jgi:hypothetical protein
MWIQWSFDTKHQTASKFSLLLWLPTDIIMQNLAYVKHWCSSPLVLWDKMEVISSDCDGACHLGAINCSSQDTTPDWHIACEWTFLVDVSACMPLPRCHWSGSSTNLKVRQVHSRWNKSLHLRPCLAYYSHTLSELWHIINNWQQKHISIHLWGQSYSPFGDGSLGYFP